MTIFHLNSSIDQCATCYFIHRLIFAESLEQMELHLEWKHLVQGKSTSCLNRQDRRIVMDLGE